MSFRKYQLVWDNERMREKITRDKIRKVSLIEADDKFNFGNNKNYVCEVRKSPRAPQYEVHYNQPTKVEGIRAVGLGGGGGGLTVYVNQICLG